MRTLSIQIKILFQAFLLVLYTLDIHAQEEEVIEIEMAIPEDVDDPNMDLEIYNNVEEPVYIRTIDNTKEELLEYGLEVFEKNGFKGIKKNGVEILEPIYEKFSTYNTESSGLISFYKDDLHGLLSTTGVVKYPCKLRYSHQREVDGKKLHFIEVEGGKEGVLNEYFNEIIPPEYDYVTDISKAIQVEKNGQKALYKTNGECTLELGDYQLSYWHTNEEFILARKNGLYGIHFSNGDLISKCEIANFWLLENQNYEVLEERIALVKEDSMVFVVNLLNNEKTEFPKGVFPSQYFEDWFSVWRENKMGVWRKGEMIIPIEFDRVTFDFPGQYPTVILKKNDKSDLINLSNFNSYEELEFDEVQAVYNGYFKLKKDEQYQITDGNKNPFCNQLYTEVGCFHDNEIMVKTDQDVCYLSKDCSLKYIADDLEFQSGFAQISELLNSARAAIASSKTDTLELFVKGVKPTGQIFQTIKNSKIRYRKVLSSSDWLVSPEVTESRDVQGAFMKIRDRIKELEKKHPKGEFFIYPEHIEHRPDIGTNFKHLEIELMFDPREEGNEEYFSFITYNFNLGEYLFIDGNWVLFTEPKGKG